jgi:hypothetical protein
MPNVMATERARTNEAFLMELESAIDVEVFRLSSIRPPRAYQRAERAALPEYFALALRGLPTRIKFEKAASKLP